MLEQPYSLGARWIHTMLAPPLENHWINIAGGTVESVSNKPAYTLSVYLGENIIIPGVVNAHTHLELSQIEPAPLEVPSRSMTDWVAALLAFRRSSAYDAAAGIQEGMRFLELMQSTAAVADIVPPTLTVNGTPSTEGLCPPLLKNSFAELIVWRSELVEERFARLQHTFGLSPHAPQTVCPALLEKAINQNVPIAMHLAETLEETELLQHHTGPLLEMMRRADPDYDPKSILLGKRPLDYLQLLSTSPKTLIIHGNYLDDEELQFLAEHRETMSVVYCPRSHAYFRHSSYPLRKMLDFGVRVLLGTDSLASVPDLSLAEEIKFVMQHHPAIPAETVYRMGTIAGASALDLPKEFGTIQPGSPARFAVLNVHRTT